MCKVVIKVDKSIKKNDQLDTALTVVTGFMYIYYIEYGLFYRKKESGSILSSILSRIRSFWGSVTLLVHGLALMIHSLGVAVVSY